MAEMTFTIAGGPGIEVHVEEVDGDLRFTVTVLGDGGLTADLRGFFFQVADESLISGLQLAMGDSAVTEFRAGEDSVSNLGQGANMQGAASAFDVGVEIGTAGIGRDDVHSTTFVLSHATKDLSLDLIASQEFGVRLTSVGAEGGGRNDGLKLVGTAPEVTDGNTPPVAVGDADATNEDAPITISVLANDSDADGDALAVSLGTATSALGAAISVDADGIISYDPTGSSALSALNTGESRTDSFSYTITDADGATSTATVEVLVSGVTDVVDGFLGAEVNYSYVNSNVSMPLVDTPIEVTDPGIEVDNVDGGAIAYASLDITDNQIIVDYLDTFAAETWTAAMFNGFRIADVGNSLDNFVGVTIAQAIGFENVSGATVNPVVSWDANTISVNWQNLSFTPDTRLVLDVVFG